MNNTITEKIGVTYLNDVLLKSEIIDPDIRVNDKTLSWDGTLYVYNSDNFKKSNLFGTIPVQVKSRTVKKFNKNISIKLEDIVNYEKEKRVIYFTIQLKGDEYKIYYKSMLLWDLNKFIKRYGSQKSKTVSFNELKIDDSNDVKMLVRNFIEESQKQSQLIPNVLSMEEYLDKVSKGIVQFDINVPENSSYNDIVKEINLQKPYLYHISNDLNVKFPIDRIDGENIKLFSVHDRELNVGIKNEVLYHQIQIIDDGDSSRFNLGNNICAFLKNKTFNFKFQIKGDLSERIKVLKLLIGIVEGNPLQLGEFEINLNHHISVDQYEHYKKLLKFYLDIEILFKKLGVKKLLDIDSLTDKDFNLLNYIIKSELYDEPVFVNAIDMTPYYLKCGNICILCIAKREDNKCWLYNIFHDKIVEFFISDEDEQIPISKYLILCNDNYFEIIDNINYEELVISLKNYLKNEKEEGYYNLLLLKMLLYYDKVKNEDVLNASLDLSEFIYSKKPSNINYINYCQTKLRKGILQHTDLECLINIKNTEDDLFIKCGCCILLNAKKEFELYFCKLSSEEQNSFKELPIYSLYEKN